MGNFNVNELNLMAKGMMSTNEPESMQSFVSGTNIDTETNDANTIDNINNVIDKTTENNLAAIEAEHLRQQQLQKEKEEQDKKLRQDIAKANLAARAEEERKEREEYEKQFEEELKKQEEEALAKKGQISSKLSSFVKKIASPTNKKQNNNEDEIVDNKDIDFEFLATHDQMTGLKNTTALNIDKMNIGTNNLSCIFCDINNLKIANDTYGHAVGNKLILAVASELNRLFPGSTYRIGGDEFVVISNKYSKDTILYGIQQIENTMNNLTKNNNDNLVYSVSIGYSIGDGTKNIDELQQEADKAMYEVKKQYKKDHPEQSVRQENNTNEVELDYDDLLTNDQKELKEIVRENHQVADEDRTERIIMELQQRHQEVLAILIASPTFDHLFIFRNISRFLNMLTQIEDTLDYSYLYVLYEGGPQYYGADDYYMEISHLFEDITSSLRSGRPLTDRDIKKIKGINIFKEIYLD